MTRRATGAPRFLDYVAARWLTPEDAAAHFLPEAQAAAASVGARLDDVPLLDGRRTYLPGLNGARDKRQYCIASIEIDRDGTAWPAITFASFRHGGETVFWKPRDAAWQLFAADRSGSTAHAASDADRERYAEATRTRNADAAARVALAAEQERAAHEAAAAAANVAWDAASEPAAHPYLAAKSVGAHGVRVASLTLYARLWDSEKREWVNSIASRAGDLLIPMRDRSGRLLNLQRIAADGRKLFLRGSRKIAACHRIEGTTPVWLAEGYATAATVHAATGCAVVVAFDAGSLVHVARELGAELHAVAADNDPNGAGEKAALATGLPYVMPPHVGSDWNDHGARHGLASVADLLASLSAQAFTRPYDLPNVEMKGAPRTWLNKLQATTTAAGAAALIWAIGRRWCPRVPVQQSLAELVAELAGTAPVRLVHPSTIAAITAALGRMIEWRKRRALTAVMMSPDALARHRVEVVAELPRLARDQYRGVVLVNAPMGSGKTRYMGKPFAEFARSSGRFVATCHRQSLVAELARVMDCEHYQDTPGEDAWAVQALATCLPSIVKDSHKQIIDNAAFVFIDEIAQVLRSIESRVSVADKKAMPDVWHRLRGIVANADCVMCADAGMDDRTLAFIERCRPGERFRVIQAPHCAGNLQVSFGHGKDALAAAYGEALARLSEGERLWIGCGEKSRAIEAARVLASSGARILLLHGDNRENTEPAAFWRDPEAVSRRYDCVIHTGVISSGMSIEHRDGGPHFTHGMLIASGATITPADALQMLRRVRYLKTWTVTTTPNHAHDIDNADAILSGMHDAACMEALPATDCTDFDSFIAGIKADGARHRADFAAGLWWALEHQGFSVEHMAIGDSGDTLDADLKSLRAAIRAEHREAILAARDLSESEARRLRDNPAKSEADVVALLRHRVKADLGLDALDGAALDVWDDGRGPARMDRFSAATQGLADAFAQQGRDLSQRRFAVARVVAYEWLFDGIDLRPGLRITGELAGKVVARVIERRFLLAFLKIVPAKWARDVGGKAFPVPAYPAREVSDILEKMGLALRRREGTSTLRWGDITLSVTTPSEGKSARSYWHEVTPESWAEVSEWAARRNARRAVIEAPIASLTVSHWRLGSALAAMCIGGVAARIRPIGTAAAVRAVAVNAAAVVGGTVLPFRSVCGSPRWRVGGALVSVNAALAPRRSRHSIGALAAAWAARMAA